MTLSREFLLPALFAGLMGSGGRGGPFQKQRNRWIRDQLNTSAPSKDSPESRFTALWD